MQSKQRDVGDLHAGLDLETRIVGRQRTGEIKTLMQRTAQDLIEIGQKLVEVKARLGHGRFGAWLQVGAIEASGTPLRLLAGTVRLHELAVVAPRLDLLRIPDPIFATSKRPDRDADRPGVDLKLPPIRADRGWCASPRAARVARSAPSRAR